MIKLTKFQQQGEFVCSIFYETNYWAIWVMSPDAFDDKRCVGGLGNELKFTSETDAIKYVQTVHPNWLLLSRYLFDVERRARFANTPPIIKPEIHLVKTNYQIRDEVVWRLEFNVPTQSYTCQVLYPQDTVTMMKHVTFKTPQEMVEYANKQFRYKGKLPTLLPDDDYIAEFETRIANSYEFQRQAREE